MYRIFFIFLFCVACSSEKIITPTITTKNPELTKVITLGGSKNEAAQSVVATADGGYVVLGFTQSTNGDLLNLQSEEQYNFWVLKYTSKNILQWQKIIGGTKDDRAYAITVTKNNQFVIAGYGKSANGDFTSNNGFDDIWVLCLDESGDILWKTTTGFSGTDQALSVKQTSDGGFLVGGILDVTASGGEGNSRVNARHAGGDYWALKLNASGAVEWRKYFGGANTDTCYAVAETTQGYLLVGASDSEDVDIKNNKGTYDFWVVHINKKGKILWEKSYGGSEIDEARAVVQTNDGNYLIVGDTRSSDKDVANNNGGADLWLIKITEAGELLWEKTVGGTSFDVGRSVQKTQDGEFLIAGSSRSTTENFINKGQNDAWVLKVDANGNTLWQHTIGGSNIDFCYDATELLNGTVIAVGETSSADMDIKNNKGFSDLLIIELK